MADTLRPIEEGEDYPIFDANLPEGFLERISSGFICRECRAVVPRRDDTAVHLAWHGELAQD